jgi:TatA/E family protein of Tat protein translocase
MFGIGFQEMLIILVVVLIFFGPKRLPDLAKSLGKGIAEFKKASEEVRKGIEEAVKEESAGEAGKAPGPPATPADGTEPAPHRQEAAASPPAVTDPAPTDGDAQVHPAPGAVPESAADAATPRPG